MPQQLIPPQGGYQSLYAGRTPGEPLRPLIPTDDKPDQLCAPQHCPLPDSPFSSQSSFPAPTPVVLSESQVKLVDSTLAEVLQSLKQDIAQVQNQEHCEYTPSPDIIPSVAGGLSRRFFDKLNKIAKSLKIFMEIDLIKYYHLISFS